MIHFELKSTEISKERIRIMNYGEDKDFESHFWSKHIWQLIDCLPIYDNTINKLVGLSSIFICKKCGKVEFQNAQV
jgi:hypothetical protein